MRFLYLLAFLPFVLSRGRFDDRPYKPYNANIQALDDFPTPPPVDDDYDDADLPTPPPVDDDDADDYNDDDDDAAEDCNEDEYSTDYCKKIAENNWCEEKNFVGKCCASCNLHKKSKDLNCYDEAKGCVFYKDDMCKENHYPDQCKKTCGGC